MKGLILRMSLLLVCVCLIGSIMLIPIAESSEAAVAQSSSATNDSGSVYQAKSLADSRAQFPHFPITVNYDEQLGITFTQNFTSLEYNVTAVEQTDPTLGTGPAYLLGGLSNKGYWYQVGVSWDWSPGTGFGMNYEVWDSFGISIYPIIGGGLLSFSGIVNPGDTIALGMNLTASGEVVMSARDLNTGASGEVEYSAEGASYFEGLNIDANANGFFTGLMTEWYHGSPYYSNLAETVFSSSIPLSSAWMWMDEFNAATLAPVFAANATAVTTFSTSPTTLQEFSYGSVTEYSSAYEFVTGAISNSTTSSTLTVTATSVTTSTVTIGIPTVVSVTVTQTETQTQIEQLLFPWAYGAMAALLVIGVWIGYLVRRPKSSSG